MQQYWQLFPLRSALRICCTRLIKSCRIRNIRIIAIDEKTLQEYGKTENWSREIPAKLVETLNQSESVHPAVIAFDVMYVSDADPETDEYFAEACGKYNNVVTAVNVVQKTKVSRTESGGMEIDNSHIDLVEYPYKALKEVSDYGFANTLQDSDGYIRYAGTAVEYEGETIESLPLVVYRKYCQAVGAKVQMPKTFSNGIFSFQFSGKSGSYETVSLCDVLEGRIDPKVFNGSIVLECRMRIMSRCKKARRCTGWRSTPIFWRL